MIAKNASNVRCVRDQYEFVLSERGTKFSIRCSIFLRPLTCHYVVDPIQLLNRINKKYSRSDTKINHEKEAFV